MKAWTRWQDYVALVVGVYALLSFLWTDTNTAAMTSLIVLGALITLASLASLARPQMDSMEWVHVALGALLFIAPWATGYSDMTLASWTSWIGGVLVVAAGLSVIPMVRHIGGGKAAPQH